MITNRTLNQLRDEISHPTEVRAYNILAELAQIQYLFAVEEEE